MSVKVKKHLTFLIVNILVFTAAILISEFVSIYLLLILLFIFIILSNLLVYNKTENSSIKNLLKLFSKIDDKNEDIESLNSNEIHQKIEEKCLNILNQLTKQKKFTEDVAHELKTPLTILRGELELALLANKTDKDYIMTIASALDEVIRLSKILESLMEITHAESGKLNLDFDKKDISKLLNEIVSDAYILAEPKDISIESTIVSNIIAEYDSVRMHQAILNIVDNAIKYTPKKGKVFVNLMQLNEEIHIEIKDTGLGIPEDKMNLIFDRFYRIKENIQGKVNGVGLGLSIVNWIIKEHNGKIIVDSKVNQGTSFKIIIPKVHNESY